MDDTLIAGKYQLLRHLASGGMAEVFLACQSGLDGFEKLVVAKKISDRHLENPAAVQAFLDEARMAADLRHPNVVDIYEILEHDGGYFMIMEYLHGQNLRYIYELSQRRSMELSLGVICQIGIAAASGLYYAHMKRDLRGKSLGIVHRDVSPENIVVSYEGATKVVDFGIAKAETSKRDQTQAGVVKGKISYMSPEQVRGEPLDHRTDQFSLAICIWELLARDRLFKRENQYETMHAIADADVRPARFVNPEVPEALDVILQQALAARVEARYDNCALFAEALENFLASASVPHSTMRVASFMQGLFDAEEVSDVGLLSSDIGPLLEPTGEGVVNETGPTRALETPLPSGPASRDEKPTQIVQHTALVPGKATPASRPPPESLAVEETLPEVGEKLQITDALRFKTNLKRSRTSFVGRARDLAQLQRYFTGGDRLVTIIGMPGTGKTRFAKHYARQHLDHYTKRDDAGGAWFCDLADATTVEAICSKVGTVLDIQLSGRKGRADVIEQIGHAIAGRGRILIILDNFEHLVDHAAATIGQWNQMAPRCRFLVTSRERLHLPREVRFELDALAVPRVGQPFERSEAVHLFVLRAQAAEPGFRITAENGPIIAEIVRQLDGLPLAIELAAARVGVFTPARLLGRLPRRLDLLRATERDIGPRQKTLRGAIDWSWNLLEPWEQAALGQCAVFVGGFTIEAAEAVLDLSAHEQAPWTLDVVQALRDKSMVRTYAPDEFFGGIRFGMYESIREYAAEKLAAAGTSGSVLQRHAEHYLQVGTAWADQSSGADGATAMQELALERENLAAVHARGLAGEPSPEGVAQALAAALALHPLMMSRGPMSIHIERLNRALAPDVAVDPVLRGRVLMARARTHRTLGKPNESRADFEAALALAREAGDRGLEGQVLGYLGTIHEMTGDGETAKRLYDEALAIHREVGDPRFEGIVLGSLGVFHHTTGKLERARQYYVQAIETLQAAGDRSSEAVYVADLGAVYQQEGKLDEASRYYEKALAIHRELGNRRFEGLVLGYLGTPHQEAGRLDEAEDHYQQALEILREVGDRRFEGMYLGYLGLVNQERRRFDEARDQFVGALHILREVDDKRLQGLFLASLAANKASRGGVRGSRPMFQSARNMVESARDPLLGEAVSLFWGHLDLALYRAARERAADEEAARYWKSIWDRIAHAEAPGSSADETGSLSLAAQSDEVRFALRLLKTAVAAETPPA